MAVYVCVDTDSYGCVRLCVDNDIYGSVCPCVDTDIYGSVCPCVDTDHECFLSANKCEPSATAAAMNIVCNVYFFLLQVNK